MKRKFILLIIVISVIFILGCGDIGSIFCGNNICEFGEEGSCPEDCGIAPEIPPEPEEPDVPEFPEEHEEIAVEEINEQFPVEEEAVEEETSVYDYDLSNYPGMFISNNKFNGVVVIGDNAPAEHVIAASDIIASIQFAKTTPTTTTTNKPVTITKIDVGVARLASEIANLYEKNLISVGGACPNPISWQLLGRPDDCTENLQPGEGKIILKNLNGRIQLIIDGYSDKDVRNAAKVLANYQDYTLYGKEICVYSSDSKLSAYPCKTSKNCFDSDGGIKYYKKGTVYGDLSPFGSGYEGVIGEVYDFCVQLKEDGSYPWVDEQDQSNIWNRYEVQSCKKNCAIYEMSCKNGVIWTTVPPCPNSCQDGACIGLE